LSFISALVTRGIVPTRIHARDFGHTVIEGARNLLTRLANEAVDAVHPDHVLRPHVAVSPSGQVSIFQRPIGDHALLAIGKGSLASASAYLERTQGHVSRVVVVEKYGDAQKLAELQEQFQVPIQLLDGDHPYPSEKSANVQESLKQFAYHLKPHVSVVSIISGGSSSLMNYAPKLGALRETALSRGLPIETINLIFREMGPLAGGRLGELLMSKGQRSVFGLYISDVQGGIETIGSGPLLKNPTSGQAKSALEKYGLSDFDDALLPPASLPNAISSLHHIVSSKDMIFDQLKLSVEKAGMKAVSMGSEYLSGPVNDVIPQLIRTCNQMNVQVPHVVICSGEPEHAVVDDPGYGGRSQVCAAIGAQHCDAHVSGVFFGLDGDDGLHPKDKSPVAGAFFDSHTCAKGFDRGLDLDHFLKTDNLYPFFDSLGQHLTLDKTTNVCDCAIILVNPKGGKTCY